MHGRKTPFEESEASEIMRQLLVAILYLHTKEIMHRDIKAENIMLSPKHKLTLVDFGLSEFTNSGNQDFVGTRYYVAPEMIRGPYTKQVDLWSAGVVAYLLLTKKVPFGGETREETFENILSRRVGFPKDC